MSKETLKRIIEDLKLDAGTLKFYELSEYVDHPANKTKRKLINKDFNNRIIDIELLEKELGFNNE